MPTRDIVLAVLIQLMWGIIFVVAKPALAWFSPITMMAICYVIVALLFWPLAPRARTPWPTLLAVSFFGGALQSTMTFYSLVELPVSTAVLLIQTQLPFAVLTSWIIGRDKPNLRSGIGCVLALIGVAIVIGPPEPTTNWFGIGMAVGAAFFWAVVQGLLPVISKDTGMDLFAAIARWAAPQLVLAGLVFESSKIAQLGAVPLWAWASLGAVAVFGFALPYAIWYRLLLRNRVDQVVSFLLLLPPIGVIAAAWQLDESLPPSLIVGGAVILAGLAAILWRPARKVAA